MPRVFYEVTEHYSAQQMYDLVNDVDAYPQFVQGCVRSGIIERTDHHSVAFLEVEKLGFKKRFVTANTLKPAQSIAMKLVEGPFQHLSGTWSFIPLSEQQCTIRFNLDFEFKNKLLAMTFTPIFKELMSGMVNAFSQRAKKVYGKQY